MIPTYAICIRTVLTGLLILPFILIVCAKFLPDNVIQSDVYFLISGLALVSILVIWRFQKLFNRVTALSDQMAADQFDQIANMPMKYVPVALVVATGLSLFFELSLIRWHSAVFEFFSFYKNFSLLACFAGLGLGYALADKKHLPLLWSPFLLFVQVGVLLFLRYGLNPIGLRIGLPIQALNATPISEDAYLGFDIATTLPHLVAIYFFLTFIFLLVTLMMLPIGQLCGALMHKVSPLRGYGLVMLGSILGVCVSIALSYLWTPPAVWFGLFGMGLVVYINRQNHGQLLGGLLCLGTVILLAWPVHFPWSPIYSPYQLLEHGPGENGWMTIRAEGHFFQSVYDLSKRNTTRLMDRSTAAMGRFYDLPYQFMKSRKTIAIVGSGSGNDVAAAIRAEIKDIDAVEIDPAIFQLGAYYHPEAPYSDPRVNVSIGDARSFLREGKKSYDMILYGLLDSRILLNRSSSLRIDSYVYTVEALKEARKRLTENGVLCLSFAMMSDIFGRKLYLMIEEVFDGRPPICVRSKNDGGVIFIQSNNNQITFDPEILDGDTFTDVTSVYKNLPLQVELPTDDWPFFYMADRTYPFSYMYMFILITVVTAVLLNRFKIWRPVPGRMAFFLLGAGFMLIETKGITEMGLQFGNSWQVVGITIICILSMSLMANVFVATLRIYRITLSGIFLLFSLGLGIWISTQLPSNSGLTETIIAMVLLTCPVFFSGIIFSVLLRKHKRVSNAMAFNLFGAMVGGILEYHALAFGFQSLYWIAIVIFGLAIFCAGRSTMPSKLDMGFLH